MANHDELKAFPVQFGYLNVHLGNQGAGCIKNTEATGLGLIVHRPAHTVRRENEGRTGWNIGQIFDKNCTFFAQIVHNESVVNNLMAYINRCAKLCQGLLHDFNRAVHSGTKATRLRQNNFLQCGLSHSTPIKCTSNTTGWPASG